jgi:hypothetical protein
MLFTGPSQVSWILGVTEGDTDADTMKCVGLLSLEFWIPVLSSMYCGHQLVDPNSLTTIWVLGETKKSCSVGFVRYE